jgi:hypothetical protein
MAWQISGQYMETCNCTFLCPCITSNLAARPTEGDCKAALALHIAKGSKDGIALDGVNFILMLKSQGPMGAGNMTVGLIIDTAASDEQAQAVGAIASGAAGGPMAMLAPLVGKMAGIERREVRIGNKGTTWSASAAELLDEACEGLPNMATPPDVMMLDNVSHPLNSRLALAKATRSRMSAFGIEWDDSTGTRNGHFAPFTWSG